MTTAIAPLLSVANFYLTDKNQGDIAIARSTHIDLPPPWPFPLVPMRRWDQSFNTHTHTHTHTHVRAHSPLPNHLHRVSCDMSLFSSLSLSIWVFMGFFLFYVFNFRFPENSRNNSQPWSPVLSLFGFYCLCVQ